MKISSATQPRRSYSQVARAAAAEATSRRISESFLDLLMSEWFDDITLDRVAARAGVAVPTLVRFGGKDALLASAVQILSTQINERRASPPGDVEALVDGLIADYERTGDAILRLLVLAPRYRSVDQVVEFGRTQHREWVANAFAEPLSALKGAARQGALDTLVVATDVYVWKLLRRDLKRSLKDSTGTMRNLIAAAITTCTRVRQKGEHR